MGVLGVRTGILDGEVGASTFKGRVQYHSTEFTRGGGGAAGHGGGDISLEPDC